MIDTRAHGRPAGRHGRGPRTLRRRVVVLMAASLFALTFFSLKQSPQPHWQGFVTVRGLQVNPSPSALAFHPAD